MPVQPTAFNRVNDEETGYSDDLNQIIEAWEGDEGKGIALDLDQVYDTSKFAAHFRNRADGGQHLWVEGNTVLDLFKVTEGGIYIGDDLHVPEGVLVGGLNLVTHNHTDEDGMGEQIPEDGLADDAVTEDKIEDGAVTLLKLIEGAMVVLSHQGASNDDWSASGSSDHVPDAPVGVQVGRTAVTLASGERTQVATATFDYPFDDKPLVFPVLLASPEGTALSGGAVVLGGAGIYDLSRESVTLKVHFPVVITGGSYSVAWIAVGYYTPS